MWSSAKNEGLNKFKIAGCRFLFLVLGGVMVFLSAQCSRSTPVDFKAGEYKCEFCQMDIVDMRFKAEILTRKGKVHRFDSIECMMGWAQSHREEVSSRWVSDFYHPEQWIALEKVFILKSEQLASPMGAYLSAYSTAEERDRARQEYGGQAMDIQGLETYIERQWKK